MTTNEHFTPITDPTTQEALARASGHAPEATPSARKRLTRIGAAAVGAAIALGGILEISHPKPVGEGVQRVQADTLDEAMSQVEGIENISKEAARSDALHQRTSDPNTFIVPERVQTERDLNPFNNQPSWEGRDSINQDSGSK